MSSEQLGAAQNVLKGNLGSAWDITNGYQDAYTDLGIARRFGGAAAAYSLRDIGAMNGRVVKVRRSGDDVEEDFSASQVQSGALENWVNGNLDSTLPADVATSAGAYSLRKASSLKTIYNQSSFPNTDVSPLVKNMTYNSFAGNVDGYQGKDNLIKLEMDASDGAGGPDIPRTPQVALGLDSYKSSRTGTVTFEYYIESDSPLVGGYWIVGNESNQYSPEGVKIIGGAWTTAVVQFKDKTGSSTNTVYSDQGRLLSIRDASVGGQPIKINRDSTSPFIHFSSFLVTATDFSLVRIRRSSDNIEVNVGFDEDEKVSLNSLVGNVNEEGGDIGITNARTLNEFLNESVSGFIATSYAGIDASYKHFTSDPTISNTAFSGVNGGTQSRLTYQNPFGYSVSASDFDGCKVKVTGTVNTLSGGNITIKPNTQSNGGGSWTPAEGNKVISDGTTGSFEYIFTGNGTNLFKSVVFLIDASTTVDVSNLTFAVIEHGATVHTWNDQAGANDAVEATSANQPKIASNGALLSGINFDGNTFLNIAADLMNGTDGTTFMVASNIDTDQETFYLSNRDGGTGFHFKNDTSHKGKLSYNFIGSNAQISTNAVVPDSSDNKQLFGFVKDSNDTELFNNALQLADGTASQTYSASSGANTSIGKQGNSSSAGANKTLVVYELISYDSDQSNNRFKIESNINNYYGLYNDENDLSSTSFAVSGGTLSGSNTTDGFTCTTTSSSEVRANFKNLIPSLSSDSLTFHMSFNADLANPAGSSGNGSPIVRLLNSSEAVTTAAHTVTQGFNSFSNVVNQNTGTNSTILEFFDNDANTSYSISDIKISLIERNGFVPTWYDQSTSGNNCTQSSASLQPFIVSNGGFCGVFMAEIVGGSEPNARNLRIDDIQTTDLGNNFGLIWVGTVDDTYSNAHPTTLVGANRNIVTQNQGTVGLNIKLSGDEFTLKNETSGSSNVNSGFPTFTYTPGDRVSVAGTCVGPDGDGDHTLKAYVNGATPVSNNDTLVLTDSSDDFRIMASNFSNTVRRDRSTIGKVDEVIIFASNIEPDMEEVRAEINNHYNIY